MFFEYISYRNFYPFHTAEWENLDYVGLTTYKTLNDATFCAIEIKRLLNIAKLHNYDIIPLIRSSKKLLIASIKSHTTNFKRAWDALLLQLGYSLEIIEKNYFIKPFYRNSMLIKPYLLKKLIFFMNKAMDIVLLNTTIYSLLNESANYFENNQYDSIKIFNAVGYKLFPFIFERLPSFFFSVNNISICQNSVDCFSNTLY
jgi:hypothetical protein